MTAFKVDPDVIATGQEARQAVREAEKLLWKARDGFWAVRSGIQLALSRAKRDGGDVRNLMELSKELEGDIDVFSQRYETFKRLHLSELTGSIMSALRVELDDTPHLRVVK